MAAICKQLQKFTNVGHLLPLPNYDGTCKNAFHNYFEFLIESKINDGRILKVSKTSRKRFQNLYKLTINSIKPQQTVLLQQQQQHLIKMQQSIKLQKPRLLQEILRFACVCVCAYAPLSLQQHGFFLFSSACNAILQPFCICNEIENQKN